MKFSGRGEPAGRTEVRCNAELGGTTDPGSGEVPATFATAMAVHVFRSSGPIGELSAPAKAAALALKGQSVRVCALARPDTRAP